VLAGCRGRPQTTSEQGTGAAPPIATAPPAAVAPRRDPFDDERTETPAAPLEERLTLTEVPAEEEPDDTEARVRAAFGYPAECLGADAVDPGVERFTVGLHVTITATGIVTRAAATSSALTPSARACVETRARRMRVAGPIREAPRDVSTTFEYTAPPRPARAEAPPAPPAVAIIPGAQPAAAALPAVAGDPPRDVQPPAYALPAVVGDGPAPGSVPPAHTLPAVGGTD
jgi:hypothetical protein